MEAYNNIQSRLGHRGIYIVYTSVILVHYCNDALKMTAVDHVVSVFNYCAQELVIRTQVVCCGIQLHHCTKPQCHNYHFTSYGFWGVDQLSQLMNMSRLELVYLLVLY